MPAPTSASTEHALLIGARPPRPRRRTIVRGQPRAPIRKTFLTGSRAIAAGRVRSARPQFYEGVNETITLITKNNSTKVSETLTFANRVRSLLWLGEMAVISQPFDQDLFNQGAKRRL
jgi:hypothetical protein